MKKIIIAALVVISAISFSASQDAKDLYEIKVAKYNKLVDELIKVVDTEEKKLTMKINKKSFNEEAEKQRKNLNSYNDVEAMEIMNAIDDLNKRAEIALDSYK